MKAYTSEEVVYVTSTKWSIGGLKARHASCRAAVAQIARVSVLSRKMGVDFKLVFVNDSKLAVFNKRNRKVWLLKAVINIVVKVNIPEAYVSSSG